VGFSEERVDTKGYIDLHTRFGEPGRLRKFNMRLNPAKCVWCRMRKILGIHAHAQGIEANPDKGSAIFDTQSPTTLKEVQSLVGKLTSLSRFLPRLSEKIRPIVKTLKKADRFQ